MAGVSQELSLLLNIPVSKLKNMLEQFISKIPNAERNGVGFKAPCPAHIDGGKSLSIRTGEAGILLLCASGCTPGAIVKKLGLSVGDLYLNSPDDDVDRVIAETAEQMKETLDVDLPDRFYRDARGICYKDGSKAFVVCSELTVTATTSDAESESWGRCIKFCDGRGFEHEHVIPMSMLSGDGSELRARLMDAGMSISVERDGRQKFTQLILSSNPARHVRCVNQTGWHDGAYVFPDAVIAAGDAPDLLLQNVDRAVNKYRPRGELKDWQENIGRYCQNNSRLMFSVNLAFAASILPIGGDTSGGFHLYGTSSTGKTTALLVAGSVWGGDPRKGFLETWRSTANGLEATAELHNHSLLLLDEVSQVNPSEIGEVIYSLANGFGKSRMTRTLAARRKAEWNLLFLSSGERTLEQISRGAGQSVNGGQEARFVNIDADAGKGFGLFDEIAPFEKPSDLAQKLSTASKTYYGTPIRQFIKQVCDNREHVQKRIVETRQLFQTKQAIQDASGEIYRVASRFALVTAAGTLAVDFGLVKWTAAEVIACGERLFAEWIEARGGTGSYDVATAARQVLIFIERHGSSRFQDMNKLTRDYELAQDIVRDRAGFKRTVDGVMEFLILPDVFENEICKGNTPRAVAKELERQGYLRRGKEAGSLQRRETLPELGRNKRVYAIVPQLPGDENEATEC